MIPEIKAIQERKFIGMKIRMSLMHNRTFELWREFMPRKKEILDVCGTDLFSVEMYPPGYFQQFDLGTSFEKWASVEVRSFSEVPEGMESFTVPAGLYAVFVHRGAAARAQETYSYIFNEWLPASPYQLDHRPHFACMGEKYNNDSIDSEEELWIPVQAKP